MATPRAQLLERIADLAGRGVLQIDDALTGWPGLGTLIVNGEPVPVALYVGPVGLSHRQRDHVERRFQNPGSHRPIRGDLPERTALLIGLWDDDPLLEVQRPVLVVADPVRRIGHETRFSVFADVEALLEATRTGWAEDVNADGERMTYLSPETLGSRLAGLPKRPGQPPLPFGKRLSGPRARPARPRAADPFPTDPDKVDRGTQAHYDVEEALRSWVVGHGAVAVEPRGSEPPYDLGWAVGKSSWIAEIKSLTAANEEKQMRYGLGQLLQYATALAGLNPRLALVVERSPANQDWIATCASVNVTLTWPTAFDLSLVKP